MLRSDGIAVVCVADWLDGGNGVGRRGRVVHFCAIFSVRCQAVTVVGEKFGIVIYTSGIEGLMR